MTSNSKIDFLLTVIGLFVNFCSVFRYQKYWSDIHRASEANASKAQVQAAVAIYYISCGVIVSFFIFFVTSRRLHLTFL